MTTIAWDGENFVADKQTTKGSLRGSISKIYEVRDGFFIAGCGDMEEIALVIDWIRKGSKKKNKPEIDCSEFLLLDKKDKSCYHMSSKLVMIPSNIPAAIGSGGDFAMGAMLAGVNAIQAVEIASKLDVYTGEGYTVISTNKPKRK